LKLNILDKLKDIYGYDDFEITMITELHKLKQQNAILQKENTEMKTLLVLQDASPDGILYFEAQKERNILVKQQNV
jgi:hypothetical protein